MGRFRLAVIVMIAGIAVKTAGVTMYHLVPRPVLAHALLAYDPVARRFADVVLALFFHRGIAPTGESTVYELLLILASGAECFALGLLVTEILRLKKARQRV
jgi:hypothetical protein